MRAELMRCPPSWCYAVIRSCLGGWVTTTRLANPDEGCLLGCGEGSRDSMKHYISCRRFSWCVARAQGFDPPSDPLKRFGLDGTTDELRAGFKHLTLCYHFHRILHADRQHVQAGDPEVDLERARAALLATELASIE